MNGPQNNNALEAAMVLASISDTPVSNLISSKQPKNSEELEIKKNSEYQSHLQRKPIFFPKVLMDIISDPEYSDVMSWLPQGFAFMIKDFERLDKEIMSKLRFEKRTVQNELNRWGFKIISRGPRSNVYFHQYFHRDSPSLCTRMRITGCTTDTKVFNACDSKKKRSKACLDKSKIVEHFVPINQKKYPKNAINSYDGCNVQSRTVSPSIEGQTHDPISHIDKKNKSGDDKLEEQKKLLLSFFSERKQANDKSLCVLSKQFKPGSKLAEMNKSIHSFRDHHNLVISKSIDALLCAKSS